MLTVAALLCLLLGIAHSYLGERYILTRLFRRDNLPELFGSDFFTKGTLRFCWHVMSFAVWGFGYLLWQVGRGHPDLRTLVLQTSCAVFLASALFAFGFTKGRHLSWIALLAVAVISFNAI